MKIAYFTHILLYRVKEGINMNVLSPSTKAFIDAHLRDNVKELALQAAKYPGVDLREAITQISGRQVALAKIPSWAANGEIRYPRHLSMEQCSSENTAHYKASLVGGTSLTDLTGGFGVDCAFMGANFERVDYVERQTELCDIAQHNFAALGLNQVVVHNQEATEYLPMMPPVEWIFIDPARRDGHGGKTVAISDCEPNVEQLEALLTEKANRVMVKLSPMLDVALALTTLQHICEVHIVSAANDCKELLLILNSSATTTEVPIHCVNLTAGSNQHFTFTREAEQQAVCSYTDQVGRYLYEPNASVMKAGAYRSVAAHFELLKLHPNSHLYTSDRLVADFPGRAFEVVGECTFNKKELKTLLGDLKKANLTVRNFPATVAELRKRTKLAEGGEDYLFATTLANDKKVLIRGIKPDTP